MIKPIEVSASILCADFTRLKDEIKKCERSGVDSLHVDVMDGHFVPNITIGAVIVEAIRPLTKLPIASHLMIEQPGAYIDQFIDAGSDTIMIQVECYGKRRSPLAGPGEFPKEVDTIDAKKINADIMRIKKRGKKAFAVINPGTPLCIDEILKSIDGVLIMSVNPGFAKQKFMESVLPKIESLRKKYPGDIAIDGGINEKTAPRAVAAGINILATASYFFGAQDPQGVVWYLKSLKGR